MEKNDKIIPISDQSFAERLMDNNPALLSALLKKAEQQIQEETKGASLHPEKQEEFLQTINELRELLEPLNGEVSVWTDVKQKALRHYIDIEIPDDTAFDGEEFQKLLQLLGKFSWCNFRVEVEEETVVLNLSFAGIWE